MIFYDKKRGKKRKKLSQTALAAVLIFWVIFGKIVLRNGGTERNFDLLMDVGLV